MSLGSPVGDSTMHMMFVCTYIQYIIFLGLNTTRLQTTVLILEAF